MKILITYKNKLKSSIKFLPTKIFTKLKDNRGLKEFDKTKEKQRKFDASHTTLLVVERFGWCDYGV